MCELPRKQSLSSGQTRGVGAVSQSKPCSWLAWRLIKGGARIVPLQTCLVHATALQRRLGFGSARHLALKVLRRRLQPAIHRRPTGGYGCFFVGWRSGRGRRDFLSGFRGFWMCPRCSHHKKSKRLYVKIFSFSTSAHVRRLIPARLCADTVAGVRCRSKNRTSAPTDRTAPKRDEPV